MNLCRNGHDKDVVGVVRGTNKCLECRRTTRRLYGQSEKGKEARRRYQQSEKYKEYQREYQRRYRQSEKYKESYREYLRQRWATDPNYRAGKRLNRRIRDASKRMAAKEQMARDLALKLEELSRESVNGPDQH